jgi:hypothetical protein
MDRRDTTPANQLSPTHTQVPEKTETDTNVMSKSQQILVNRKNLEMFISILTQVHLRGQLSADESAFLAKFVDLPPAPQQPNRSQRRLNQKVINDIIREERKRNMKK